MSGPQRKSKQLDFPRNRKIQEKKIQELKNLGEKKMANAEIRVSFSDSG